MEIRTKESEDEYTIRSVGVREIKNGLAGELIIARPLPARRAPLNQ